MGSKCLTLWYFWIISGIFLTGEWMCIQAIINAYACQVPSAILSKNYSSPKRGHLVYRHQVWHPCMQIQEPPSSVLSLLGHRFRLLLLTYAPVCRVCRLYSPLLEADAWLYYDEGNVVTSVPVSNPDSHHGPGSHTSSTSMWHQPLWVCFRHGSWIRGLFGFPPGQACFRLCNAAKSELAFLEGELHGSCFPCLV